LPEEPALTNDELCGTCCGILKGLDWRGLLNEGDQKSFNDIEGTADTTSCIENVGGKHE
jgi:hypothetical protein